MSFTYLLTFHPNFFLLISIITWGRTLFKFMKKFEAVLSEPCRSSLVESDKEEQLDFLPRPTDAAENETPIQSLNRALRETLLARPAAAQVLAGGTVFAYFWANQGAYALCGRSVLRITWGNAFEVLLWGLVVELVFVCLPLLQNMAESVSPGICWKCSASQGRWLLCLPVFPLCVRKEVKHEFRHRALPLP